MLLDLKIRFFLFIPSQRIMFTKSLYSKSNLSHVRSQMGDETWEGRNVFFSFKGKRMLQKKRGKIKTLEKEKSKNLALRLQTAKLSS